MVGLALVIAACIGVPCVLFYVYLRHWIFIVLAFFPPLVVLMGVIFCGQLSEALTLIAVLFGTIVALSLADGVVRGISTGLVPARAVSLAYRLVAAALVPLFAAYLLMLCVDIFILGDSVSSTIIVAHFMLGLSAALLGASLCAYFPFSEQFIARANAVRERRERLLEKYFPEIQSRWALSVAGIAIVLSTVAMFEARAAHVPWTTGAFLGFSAGIIFMLMGFSALAREWRMALALTLANLFVGVLVFWTSTRLYPDPESFFLPAMLMLSSVPLGIIAVRARSYLKEGNTVTLALAIAVRDEGAIAVVLGIAVGAPGICGMIMSGKLSPALVFAVASTFAALLLFPALTIAIHTLLPRYRTVDEVFGKR